MVKTLKYIGYTILLGLAIISLYMINLFAMKPFSMDHYLDKELIMGLLDSPEFMTYVEDIRQWAVTDLDLDIPDPNEIA